MYCSPRSAAKHYNVKEVTLRRWAASGKIECQKTAGGHHRYLLKERKSSTQEFHLKSNNENLTTKSDICVDDFQITKLLETLEEELTLNEKDLEPYWNGYAKEKSKRLPFIPEIGLRDSVANSLTSSAISSIPSSFMSRMTNQKTYQKICLRSSHNTMEVGSTLTKMTSRKIRIYPSDDLKKHLEYYFGATRYVYNKAIEFINKRSKAYYEEKNIKMDLNKSSVRKNAVTKNSEIKKGSSEEWLLNVQYLSRVDASDEALKNFSTAVKNIKRKNITHFDLKYRTKKQSRQTCYISHKAINLDNLYFFGDVHRQGKERKITINIESRRANMT